MKSDEHYICQRAANAIISEIGPFRVSTDALQAINQFLDEFIVLLLTCSLSLDLSQIKSVVVSLLPSTLGKNAIVEAELEVKTFTETESIDYDLYERMRNLAEKDFPLNEAVPLLREKCFEFCTLADKDDQLYLQKSIRHKRNEATMKVIISPIVAIYVTTVMEHIAEYLLTAVAMTAEHEDTDYVRVKEVFLALIDDIQLGDVFHRMDLKDKMEKRAGFLNTHVARASYLPHPPAPANNRKSYTMDHQNETGSFLDITFDDLDLDYFDDNPRKSTVSTTSRVPEIARPHSAMSYSSTTTANTNALHTTPNGNRKSTFHLFKNNRNSFSGDVLPRASSPASSVYDPDAPNAMNFDDLIKSGGTVKVSLTPNRLRSIEHKDELAPPQPTWERRSTSSASPRLSAVHSLPSRPSSPLVSAAAAATTTTKKLPQSQSMSLSSSSSSSLSSSNNNNEQDGIQMDYHKPKMSIEVPKINARPQTPSSPLSKKSFSINDASRFENPRNAPKPPPSLSSDSLPGMIPIAAPLIHPPSSIKSPKLSAATVKPPSIASSNSSSKLPILASPPTPKPAAAITPLGKLPTTPTTTTSPSAKKSPSVRSATVSASTPSVNNSSNDSIASTVSSVASMPSPIVKSTSHPTTISIQEPPLPRPSKSNSNNNNINTTNTNIINTNGMVIRRSSMSNRKSRENLRKLKEEQLQKELAAVVVDEPLPTAVVVAKSNDDVAQEDVPVLTEEPQQISTNDMEVQPVRQVRFDHSKSAEIDTSKAADKEASLVMDPIPTTASAPTIAPNTAEVSATTEAPAGSNGVIPRKKAATLSPERPSSMVAKRASMISSNRRRSMHEDIMLRQRVSTVGSVSVSIKQWDDILKSEETTTSTNVIPPAAHRRSVLRQLRQQQQQQASEQNADGSTPSSSSSNNNAVLDKVLKFERASTLDDHQRVSHMPRRERFLYLQQDPSAIERKSTILSPKKPIIQHTPHRAIGIDQGVQTDFVKQEPTKKHGITTSEDDDEEEHGEVDGDEEWFLQDSEWDEQEEVAMVEWLLGD